MSSTGSTIYHWLGSSLPILASMVANLLGTTSVATEYIDLTTSSGSGGHRLSSSRCHWHADRGGSGHRGRSLGDGHSGSLIDRGSRGAGDGLSGSRGHRHSDGHSGGNRGRCLSDGHS